MFNLFHKSVKNYQPNKGKDKIVSFAFEFLANLVQKAEPYLRLNFKFIEDKTRLHSDSFEPHTKSTEH